MSYTAKAPSVPCVTVSQDWQDEDLGSMAQKEARCELAREAAREIKELSHTSDLADKMVSPVPGMSNADDEIKTEALSDEEEIKGKASTVSVHATRPARPGPFVLGSLSSADIGCPRPSCVPSCVIMVCTPP